jgi:hypothetical protein
MTTFCRQCGSKFTPTVRAGRDTYRSRSGRARSLTNAQFCTSRCKQANYRWRLKQNSSAVTRKAEKIGKGPGVHSAVTPPLQHIDITREISTKNGGARPRQIAGPPLSDRSLHLARLPLDPESAANVRRANREAYTAKPYLPKVEGVTPLVCDGFVLGAGSRLTLNQHGPWSDDLDIPESLRRAPKAAAS